MLYHMYMILHTVDLKAIWYRDNIGRKVSRIRGVIYIGSICVTHLVKEIGRKHRQKVQNGKIAAQKRNPDNTDTTQINPDLKQLPLFVKL